MLARGIYNTILRVSGLLNELEEAGLHVEIGDDFAAYRRHRAAQPDRGPIYPMFDVAQSYVDPSNGFWVCGFAPDGALIHTQAARMLELPGVTLAEHMEMHRHKYITPDTTPDPDRTFYSGPEALGRITGRVCYHGDFWLRPNGLGGMRSQGATSLLSRILFELVQWSWGPDYLFALVPQQLAAKGAHLRYGYTHCEPGRWVGPDGQVTERDYLVWMSAADMANALAREPQHLRHGDRLSPVRSGLAAIDAKG